MNQIVMLSRIESISLWSLHGSLFVWLWLFSAPSRVLADDFQGATHLMPFEEETISYGKERPQCSAWPRLLCWCTAAMQRRQVTAKPSVSSQVREVGLPAATAALAIILAIGANTLAKACYAWFSGGRAFGLRLTLVLGASLSAALLMAWIQG